MVTYKLAEGFLGYRVGNDGSVWSRWKKKSLGGRRGTCQVLGDVWRPMTLSVEKRSGYLHTTLRTTGGKLGRKVIRVHVLVALTFLGPKPEGMEVRHLDGNPGNCSAKNLAWGTHKDNGQDTVRHGRTPRGEKAWKSILDKKGVLQIKERLLLGHRCKDIARDYKVHPATISDIKRGVCWGWLKDCGATSGCS